MADRLRLLIGGPRIDDRHRSLRSTLDWSYALLSQPDQAVLRRVSVFAAPFTAGAAATVLAAWAPAPAGAIPTILAGLADQSLLVAMAEPSGTRYRALETIRQYGVDRLDDGDESGEAHSRHLRWCLDASADLQVASREIVGSWRAAFDRVADELRGALAWSAGNADYRPEAYRLAIGLAELSFTRGMPSESQRRYQQAAGLAPDDLSTADALRSAAGAAESRHFGNEALQLRRAAADAALRAGDRPGAAGDLARNAELITRGPGLMATRPAAVEVEALIAEGWALAGDDLRRRRPAAARTLAEQLRDLPFYREEGHLATARLLVVTALAGDWDETLTLAQRFREGWERAGRPRAGNLSRGAYAAATVHGLRGDDDARAAWLDIVDGLATPGRPLSEIHFGEFFDALLLLHRGHLNQTLHVLGTPPEEFRAWHNGMWRPWYAALWAEAAVLSGHEDTAARVDRARVMTADNPIATAMVERAAALTRQDGDRDGLTAAAAALEGAGCRYQWARTLVFIGGEHRKRGESVLAAMGATPMAVTAVPPE